MRRKEAEEKEKYLEDVRKGKIVAHSTIQPVSVGIINFTFFELYIKTNVSNINIKSNFSQHFDKEILSEKSVKQKKIRRFLN